MHSLVDRLTRAYCLFHWLQNKDVPASIKHSLSYSALEHELRSLQVKPQDFGNIIDDMPANFDEARIAFMVRYCGLTWSTCAMFCDALAREDWLRTGTPYLVKVNANRGDFEPGLRRNQLADFMFLRPQKILMEKGRVMSFVVRWNAQEGRRLERFLRLTAARHGAEIVVHNIDQSDRFIRTVKATIGA